MGAVTPEEHLTAEHLVRMATGDLPGDQREAALSHLEVCAPCGDRLAAILLLRQGQRREARRAWVPRAAAAATVVLVAALWMLVSFPGADPAPEPLSPERQALVDRWAGFASEENINDLIYGFILRVVYPDIIPVSPGHHLPKTRAALVDLRRGRYDEAVRKLVELHLAYPDFDSIAGWLGIALYLSGETDPEVGKLLERGTRAGINPLYEACVWYGAHYLFLTGRPEEAVATLRPLILIRDHMGRMAKALLEQLPLHELDLDEESRDPSR
jgi:tetratricopeptide (TPR) repeat protein